MIKIAIADTSEGSREQLKSLLSNVDNVKVIGDTDNGVELIKIVKEFEPDVLFIEIEMKGASGIEIAKTINFLNPLIKIIFMASDEKYLNAAFNVYAYDYLVKPINGQRIIQTMGRICNNDNHNLNLSVNQNCTENCMIHNRLFLECEGKIYFINIKDIMFITRYDRKVVIVTKNQKYSVWSSMENIEKGLPDYFFRSHKGYIININNISKILPMGQKTYEVYFDGCKENALITLGRVKILKEMFCL